MVSLDWSCVNLFLVVYLSLVARRTLLISSCNIYTHGKTQIWSFLNGSMSFALSSSFLSSLSSLQWMTLMKSMITAIMVPEIACML